MKGPESGRADLSRPPPVYIGNTLVPGTGSTMGSSAKFVKFSSTEQQEEKRSTADVSKTQAILDGLQSSYTTGYSFSDLDPQHLDSVSSSASKSNAIEVIDLCTEHFDQELDGLRTELLNGSDVESEAKVKFEQFNESEQTNRDEERQSCHEHNSQPRESYGNSSGTLPEPAIVKCETASTEMTAVRGPRGATTVIPSSNLPQHLLDQIDEWYDSNPGKLPPFATACNLSMSIYETEAGSPMTYWHKSGKPLEVARLELPEHLYPTSLTRTVWRLLVAKGESIEPSIIRFCGHRKNPISSSVASAYKAWVGFDTINQNGLELQPSVFKVPAQRGHKDKSVPLLQRPSEKTHKSKLRPLRTDVKPPEPYPGQVYWPGLKRSKSQMYDLGEMVDNRDKQLPQLSEMRPAKGLNIKRPVKLSLRIPEITSAATSSKRIKHIGHASKKNRRLGGDIDDLDAITTALDPERSRNQATVQPAARCASVPIPDSLELHMRNSTVLLFFPNKAGNSSDSPRPRMLSICDSVGKIFGQALAGSVFAGSNGRGAMVLSLRIDNQDQVLPMVEDDEQDFEAFLNALKQAQCWSRDDTGTMTGSCTVEVRAKACDA